MMQPAARGYDIDFHHASLFLGICSKCSQQFSARKKYLTTLFKLEYFTAPVLTQEGRIEHQVFSISTDKKVVSRVNGLFYSDHPLSSSNSSDDVYIWFDIDWVKYRWDAQEHKIDSNASFDSTCSFIPAAVSIYDTLESCLEARRNLEYLDLLSLGTPLGDTFATGELDIHQSEQDCNPDRPSMSPRMVYSVL
jgi:hypothetical protein